MGDKCTTENQQLWVEIENLHWRWTYDWQLNSGSFLVLHLQDETKDMFIFCGVGPCPCCKNSKDLRLLEIHFRFVHNLVVWVLKDHLKNVLHCWSTSHAAYLQFCEGTLPPLYGSPTCAANMKDNRHTYDIFMNTAGKSPLLFLSGGF